LKQRIKVAFASGTDDLNARLIARMREVFPDLPLYVVSDFRPAEGDLHWVRYQGSILENWARCRSALRGKSIRLAERRHPSVLPPVQPIAAPNPNAPILGRQHALGGIA